MNITNISDLKSLIKYLRSPSEEELMDYYNPEIIIREITSSLNLNEVSYLPDNFRDYYRPISIPQKIFFDTNDHPYYLSSDNETYIQLHHSGNHKRKKSSDFTTPLVEVDLPDEVYNNNFNIYINKGNRLATAALQTVVVSIFTDYAKYKSEYFSSMGQEAEFLLDYVDEDGNTFNSWGNIFDGIVGRWFDRKHRTIIASYKPGVNDEKWLSRFPLLMKSKKSGFKYRLYYPFPNSKRDPNNYTLDDAGTFGVELHFSSIYTVMVFLEKTIFWKFDSVNDYIYGDEEYLEVENSNIRKAFLESVFKEVDKIVDDGGFKKRMELFYYLPRILYGQLDRDDLWKTLKQALKKSVNDFGRDDEEIVLNLVDGIYSTYFKKYSFLNSPKTSDTPNEDFLTDLVTKKIKNESVLKYLIYRLDGDIFTKMVNFIWRVWKLSTFSEIDPTKNPLLKELTEDQKIKSPVLLNYRTDKNWGFYTDNAEIEWDKNPKEIKIAVTQKTGNKKEQPVYTNLKDPGEGYYPVQTGTKLVDEYETLQYAYHPFAPLAIADSQNEDFILKDKSKTSNNFTHLPAFVLYANDESAFWKNVITAGEYALDVVTTFSGVGNILKVGRLVRVLKAGKSLIFKSSLATKAVTAGKAFVGVIEITSGTVNAILRITGLEDTPFGRSLTKYLFYLELLSLSGELTSGLHKLIKNSAKEALEHTDEIDNIVREANETITKNTDESGKVSKTDEVKKAEESLDLVENLKNSSGIIKKTRKFGRVTTKIMKREMPPEVLQALKQIGNTGDKGRKFTEKEILQYFTDYHNNFDYRFLNEIHDIVKLNPSITKTDAFITWGYTTNYFYWYLNKWLREGVKYNRIRKVSKLLTAAIQKMPTYSGEAFRALDIPDNILADFLKKHQKGKTVKYDDFVSCGSNTKAAFFDKPDKNVFLRMIVKDAPIISDFADGVKIRGYSKEELLLLRERKFKVLDYVKKGDKHYIYLTEK